MSDTKNIQASSFMIRKEFPESIIHEKKPSKRSKLEKFMDEIVIVLSLGLVFILFNEGGNAFAFILIYFLLMLSLGTNLVLKKVKLRCKSS